MLNLKGKRRVGNKVEVPFRLQKDTVVGCSAEVWFRSSEASAGDLLPGLMFHSLKSDFPKLQRLAAADIPKQMRDANANLLRQALQSLEGDMKRVQVGDRAMSVMLGPPYPGWSAARPIFLRAMEALSKSDLITEIERMSLKYSNIVPHSNDKDQLQLVEVTYDLAGYELRMPGRFLRAEVVTDDSISIIDIKTGATATLKGKPIEGLIVDVDVVYQPKTANEFGDYPVTLEKLHSIAKSIFFSILKKSTIEDLGPIWSES